jgi:hypothetical protein
MEYVFTGFFVVAFVLIVLWNIFGPSKYDRMTVVNPGIEYPNNHHVIGVGYYHAASEKWFPHPWNEFREGRGYYWNGNWNLAPDQRMILNSTPPLIEVERVNKEWRKADPDRMARFWETVEHEGFGTAIRRSEGS